MKKEEVKKYKIQDLTFTFEEPCFNLTEQLEKINEKYEVCERADVEHTENKKIFTSLQKKIFSKLSAKDLTEIQKGDSKAMGILQQASPEEFGSYLEAFSDYGISSLRVKNKFLNESNIKELFETCLVGDTGKIDYSVTGKKYLELKENARDVLTDFFLSIRS